MSDYPNPIIVGYTVTTLENWRDNLIEPEVPKTYRDKEDKRQEWLDNYFGVVAEAAPYCKLTGFLTSIFAVDVVNRRVFDKSRETEPNLATAFVRWILEHYQFPEYAQSGWKRPCCFYGFNPKPLLRLAGVGAVREGAEDVPVSFWYGNDECLDPKEMLLEADMKKVIGLAKILSETPGGSIDIIPGYQSHENAAMDAVMAAEICSRFQLLPATQFEAMKSLNLEITLPEPPAHVDLDLDEDSGETEDAEYEETVEDQPEPVESKTKGRGKTKAR